MICYQLNKIWIVGSELDAAEPIVACTEGCDALGDVCTIQRLSDYEPECHGRRIETNQIGSVVTFAATLGILRQVLSVHKVTYDYSNLDVGP